MTVAGCLEIKKDTLERFCGSQEGLVRSNEDEKTGEQKGLAASAGARLVKNLTAVGEPRPWE
jgi:hypothetical protein